MFDLGFLGVEKTFLNKNHHYVSRRTRLRASCRIERLQQEPFCKEDSGRKCHSIYRIKKYRIIMMCLGISKKSMMEFHT